MQQNNKMNTAGLVPAFFTSNIRVRQSILYQPDETVKLEVHIEDETVWLTQAQMVELLCSTKQNISLHINNLSFGYNILLGVKKLQKLSLRFAPLEVKADSSAKGNLPYTCAIGFNFLARFSGR